jgi:hypothetical protein
MFVAVIAAGADGGAHPEVQLAHVALFVINGRKDGQGLRHGLQLSSLQSARRNGKSVVGNGIANTFPTLFCVAS